MKPRACVVVASEMTVRSFLVRQLEAMQVHYDVTLVVNTRNPQLLASLGIAGTLRTMPIERTLSPLNDLRSLVRLVWLMRAEKFALVHSLTPKAGLLAMLAARMSRVPVRVHTFTGQVWATRGGIARLLLKTVDRVLASCATAALADSQSQREFLIKERVVSPERLTVLGHGSVSGVDATRFRPDPIARARFRESLAIPVGDLVLLFAGRLHRDKGVIDLARAFRILADERPNIHLLFVGPDEHRLRPTIERFCREHRSRVHFVDFTSTREATMAASDVLCLPSYREGFGTVIIEGGAAGLPAVASRIYGVVDAVVQGSTGLLHEPGDIGGLVAELRRITTDPSLRRSLGVAARARALRDFDQQRLTSAMLGFYARLLQTSIPAMDTVRGTWYRRYGKRTFDAVGALVGIFLLFPVAICLAVFIRAWLGSPVLFRQRRPGLHGVPFTIVKFRTMTDVRDASGRLLPDDRRLTGPGRVIRACSLDEIPELWNVLTGRMSFVGPRPLLLEYLQRYTPQQARRHDVRPGITGLAQIGGRNALTWEQKFELDLDYVDRCSPVLDLKILLRTVGYVCSRRGINQPGHATAAEFMGTASR